MDVDKSDTRLHVALRGFGEAATAFVAGWNRQNVERISAYDEKTDTERERDDLLERFAQFDVNGCFEPAAAFSDADVVVSLVYADRALDAAQDCASYLRSGAFYIDGNSCSPQTKTRAAAAIGPTGAYYIDMAIMAPVHPGREKTPVLLAGLQADGARDILVRLGMKPRIVGETVGQASAIKLTRSIMIKGMEALFAECFLAARLGGVEDEVIASLEASDPDINWKKRRAYAIERMCVHGRRRAAEMVEAANMVAELGLYDDMARGTARWEQLIGDLPLRTDRVEDVLAALGKS